MSIKDMLANLEKLKQEIGLYDSMSDEEHESRESAEDRQYEDDDDDDDYDEDNYDDDDYDDDDYDDEDLDSYQGIYAGFEFLNDLDESDLDAIQEQVWSALDEYEMSDEVRELFDAAMEAVGQTNQIVLLSAFAAGVVFGRQLTLR